MKKIVFILMIFVLGPFVVRGQTTINIKTALQGIVDNLEQLSRRLTGNEELKIRKAALKNVIDLATAESNDLKNKLIKLEGLEGDYLKLRDTLLKELGNHSNYYDSINSVLERETNLVKIKNLSTQLKDWRRIVYHPILQRIINFILVFEGRDVLQLAEIRFNNISSDLRKVSNLEIIKDSPLNNLLVKAEGSLNKARELQSASMLIILKSSNNDTQKLIEDELDKIRETYSYFVEMSDWLKKASKK
ncbi:MAG: hypothetical protein AAB847_02470 [Patescibacteria group bacterium]